LKMSLAAARGEAVRFADVTQGMKKALPMLAALLLLAYATVLGTAVAIVPGAVGLSGLVFAPVLVVDAGLRALEALPPRDRVTRGHKLRIFVLLVLAALVTAAGTLVPFFGHVAALALSTVAVAALYVRVTRTPGPRDLPLLDLREDRGGRALVQFLGALFGL